MTKLYYRNEHHCQYILHCKLTTHRTPDTIWFSGQTRSRYSAGTTLKNQVKSKKTQLSAEEFYSPYKLLACHDYSRRATIWENQKACFFCASPRNKATFRKRAHAVSKLFGSRLINADECDNCNSRFGQRFESAIGQFLSPILAVLGPANRRYKDHLSAIAHKNGVTSLAPVISEFDIKNRILHFRIAQPKVNHREIFSALLKMAASVFPRDKRDSIRPALDILAGDDSAWEAIAQSWVYIWGANEQYDSLKTIEVYENSTEQGRPRYLAWIHFNRLYFQFYIPCTSDQSIEQSDQTFRSARGFFTRDDPQVQPVGVATPKKRLQYSIAFTDPEAFDSAIQKMLGF